MGTRGAKQTPESLGFAETMIERLAPVATSPDGVTSRKMFGGVGIFDGGSMFAMVTSKGVFRLKVGDGNRDRFEAAGCEPMGRMPYWTVPSEVVEDTSALVEWAATSITEAHRGKS